MKILFGIGHPAHYHLFKNLIANLQKEKHQILIVYTSKDVLKELICGDKFFYELKAKSKYKIIKLYKTTFELNKVVAQFKPDLMITCITQVVIIGRIKGIPTLFFGEDDFKVTWLQGLITYPLVTEIVTPSVTSIPIYKKKQIRYSGYHELAYLHPSVFKPNLDIVNKYINCKKYFIIRLSALNAYHDYKVKGITNNNIDDLISILKKHGEVFISSERRIDHRHEAMRLAINPNDIHHVIAFSTALICDSQTMAAEAGVLGVPFFRYNDLVGKISYLNEMENKYKLGFGYKTNQYKAMIKKIDDLLKGNKIESWDKRRDKMLFEKIDVNKFYFWLSNNYPNSARVIKDKHLYNK